MSLRNKLFLGFFVGILFWIATQFNQAQGIESTPVATSEATSPPLIKFKGVDDITIYSLYYPTSRPSAPSVLLINFKDSWAGFTPKWNALGYNVFAIDLRDFSSEDPVITGKKSIQDILLVIDQINKYPHVTPHQIALIGGSYFGGQALVACAKSTDCKTVIMLSGTNYKGDLDDPIATLGKRPLLMAVSKGEGIIAEADQDYARRAQGEHQLIMYDGSNHAMALLSAHPELVGIIGDWLVKYLPIDDQATAAPTP